MDSPTRQALEDVLRRVGRDIQHPPSLADVLGEVASSVGQDVATAHTAEIAEALEQRFLARDSIPSPDFPPARPTRLPPPSPPSDEDHVDDVEMDRLIPDPARKKSASSSAAGKAPRTTPSSSKKKSSSGRSAASSSDAMPKKRKKSVKEKLMQTKDKKGKKTKKKLPGQPPNPRTSYQIFQDEMRPTIRSRHPNATFGELSKLISAAWKDLAQSQRDDFVRKAEKEKELRRTELREWVKNNRALLETNGAATGVSPKKPKKPPTSIAPLNVKIPRKLRKRDVESDGVDLHVEDGEMVVEQAPKTAFDQAFEQNKKSKKRFVIDEETISAGVQNLLSRMDAAHAEDYHLMEQKKPATKKLAMSKEVVTWLSKKNFQRPLMDEGILARIRDWLSPLADGSLPNETLRKDMYNLLDALPTEFGEEMTILNYLEESEDEHVDGLGKVLMHLWRRENPQNKAILRNIIERWARPLFGSTSNYKQLASVEEQNAQQILQRGRRLSSSEQPLYLSHHARIPNKAAFDYAVRPQNEVNPDEAANRKRGRVDDSVHNRISKKLQNFGVKKARR
eukprot:TRINITY_DN1651_c0_g1_i3.p1 TRINITY_DN1651_c0_g1~~TRINITY_DN1651_c0_g1_i3.p1  ORF type:complete len:565 (+),score=146.75 TRINITY_DN1651_c0_g1_i3:576-2270(+)